jgi:hypothetical protein
VVFFVRKVPDTKDRTLEQIQHELTDVATPAADSRRS